VWAFTTYGLTSFIQAKVNEESDFKPEWKTQVVDYTTGEVNYEMPNIYFEVYIYIENVTEDEVNVTDLLNQIVKSQNDFNNSVSILSADGELEVLDVVASTTASDLVGSVGEGVGFWGWIKLELSDPNPSPGEWNTILLIDVSVMDVEHLLVTIGRDDNVYSEGLPVALNWYEVDDGNVNVFLFEYTEIVTHKYHSNTEYYDFDISWSQTTSSLDFLLELHGVVAESSDIILVFTPDLKIEHWNEYVTFGYWNWLTAMGGLLTIAGVVFFKVSFQLAKRGENGSSMGILPFLSSNFSTYENVHLLRIRVIHLEQAMYSN